DHHLRQAASDMSDQRHRQVRNPDDDIGRAHELANQQEERYRQQRLGIDTIKDLLHDGRQRDVGEERAHEHTGEKRKRYGYAEIAKDQEAERHQRENDWGTHVEWLRSATVYGSEPADSGSGGSGWSKPLATPLTNCSSVNSAINTPETGMTM